MKSRISIDVDYDNQPVIKIEYYESEDVRDKLVKKFLETFGGSCWAQFFYRQGVDALKSNNLAFVRPICAYDLPKEQEFFNKEADAHRKLQEQLSKDMAITEEVTRTAEKLNSES